jgi:general secretion pathway protein D
MKRWYFANILCLIAAGCSQKSEKVVSKKSQLYSEKISFLKDLHSQFPSSFSLALLLSFIQKNQLSEASSYINKTLENYPNCAALHIAQGFIWEARALLGESNAGKMATVAYQAALTADQSNPAAHYLLGQQYLSQGDSFMAQRHFAQGVMMRPDEHKLLYVLACASYRNGDIKTAYCSIKKALSLCSKNPLYYRTASVIYAASGHFQDSQVAFDCYAKLAGKSSKGDLQHISNRIQYWKGLHANTKISRMADNDEGKKDDKDAAKEDDVPSIILNGYILLVNQSNNQQKGNNVFNAYDQVKNVTNPLSVVLGGSTANSTGRSPLLWWARQQTSTSATPSTTLKGHTFNYNITPSALNYALNIANASRSIATYSSRPTISTLMGKPAAFFAGSVIQAAPAGGSLVTIDAGDKLEVKPINITEDGLITLDITMTSAAAVGDGGSRVLSQSAISQGLGDQLVQVNSSKISTIVKVYAGQTIIVGGLKTTVKKVADSRFPVLGNIPILQYFFSAVNNNTSEATILYLLSVQLGGQAKTAYTKTPDQSEVFKDLQRADPSGFTYSGPSTYALILKHLGRMSLVNGCQSGDALVIPESQLEPLSERLSNLSSFFYF